MKADCRITWMIHYPFKTKPMTPKEKAKELFFEYNDCLLNIAMGANGIEDMIAERAKMCALICAEQMIGSLESYKKYWQEVKKEIENI